MGSTPGPMSQDLPGGPRTLTSQALVVILTNSVWEGLASDSGLQHPGQGSISVCAHQWRASGV